MNVFSVARECFNRPEQYALISTRAQSYVMLYDRNIIDREEYINLMDDLFAANKQMFDEENHFAVKHYFKKMKEYISK